MTTTKTLCRQALPLLFALSGLLPPAAAYAENETFITQALKAVDEGDYSTAIIHLKNAVKLEPDDPEARWLLGRAYLKKGDGNAAEVELRRLRRMGMPRQQWWLDLADAYLLQGKSRDVMGVLAEPEPLKEGEKARFYLLSGSARLGLGELESGAEDLRKAVELDPNNARAQLTLARIAIAKKNYQEAERLLDAALASQPRDAGVWLLKGELARIQGDYQDSLDAFRRAGDLDSDLELAQVGEAITLIGVQRYQDAREIVNSLLRKDLNMPMGLYLRGLLEFKDGNLTSARTDLEKVQAAIPNHLPSALLLGTIHYQTGNYAIAEELIKQYVTRQPNVTQARKLLAAVYIRTKQAKRAVELLEQGLGYGENDPTYVALLGSALMQAGDVNAGTEYLEKAVEIAPDAAAIRAQLGLGLLATGQAGRAEEQLSSAVDLGDDLLQADLLLILTQIKQKELDRALASVDNLLKRHPDSALAHNLRGSILVAKGNAVGGRLEYEESEKLKPDFFPARLNQAALDRQEGKYDSAQRRYQGILKLQPGNQKAMLGLAQLAESRKDTAGMIQWLEKAREADPAAAMPRVYLARYHMTHGDAVRAADVARELSLIYPNNASITLLYGQTLLASGDALGAEDQFRQLIALNPDSPEGWYQLAGAQLKQDKIEPAKDSLNRALNKDPENIEILVSLGRLSLKTGDNQKALEFSNEIRKKDPARSAGYTIGGAARLALNQLVEAEALLDRGEQSAPAQETVMLHARVLARMGRLKQAGLVLANWLKKHPDDFKVRYNFASLLQQTEQTAAAQLEYERILDAQPDNAIALNNLAWIYTENKDPRALDTAAKAHGLRSNDPYVADTYGWAKLAANQVTDAIALFRRAIQQAPNVPDFRYHLAVALSKSGKKSEAVTELKRLLQDHSRFADRDDAEALLRTLE